MGWIILSILGILGVMALRMSPRIRLSYDWKLPDVPESALLLEQYVEGTESGYQDIKQGTEKRIVWNNPEMRSHTEWVVVYLHGFSGSRQEVVPFCDDLARALGANLFYQRLAGHGLPSEALSKGNIQLWMNDAAEALAIGKRLGKRVLLVGTSTGATLSLLATLEAGDEGPNALVLISPNFGPSHFAANMALWPGAPIWVPLLFGKVWHWAPINEDHRRYWSCDYPMRANLEMMAVVTCGRAARLENICCPVLCFYSEQDRIVKPELIVQYFAAIGSQCKELVEVGPSGDPRGHVLAGKILAPENTDRLCGHTLSFIQQLGDKPAY